MIHETEDPSRAETIRNVFLRFEGFYSRKWFLIEDLTTTFDRPEETTMIETAVELTRFKY